MKTLEKMFNFSRSSWKKRSKIQRMKIKKVMFTCLIKTICLSIVTFLFVINLWYISLPFAIFGYKYNVR